MARKTSCGGLLYNEEDFKEIDGVLTLTNIDSVDDYFVAHNCGGQKFDSAVFSETMNGNFAIISFVGKTATNPMRANCSLTFDAENFSIGEQGELKKKESSSEFIKRWSITWDGNTDGRVMATVEKDKCVFITDRGESNYNTATLYKVSDLTENLLTAEDGFGLTFGVSYDERYIDLAGTFNTAFFREQENCFGFCGGFGKEIAPSAYVAPMMIVVLEDETQFRDDKNDLILTFPEKGVYFVKKNEEEYMTNISKSIYSYEWDGNETGLVLGTMDTNTEGLKFIGYKIADNANDLKVKDTYASTITVVKNGEENTFDIHYFDENLDLGSELGGLSMIYLYGGLAMIIGQDNTQGRIEIEENWVEYNFPKKGVYFAKIDNTYTKSIKRGMQ